MTHDDWQQFRDYLISLYPTKANSAPVLEEWKKRVMRLDLATAKDALSNYYGGEKKGPDGAQPAIAGFMRHVSKIIGRSKAKGNAPGRWDHERAMIRQSDKTNVCIDNFTDDDFDICAAANDYYRGMAIYGPDGVSTVGLWNTWQRLLKWAGYDAAHWTSDMAGERGGQSDREWREILLAKRAEWYVMQVGPDLPVNQKLPLKSWLVIVEDHGARKSVFGGAA